MTMMACPFSAAFPKPIPNLTPTASAVLRLKAMHPAPSQPKSFPGAGRIRPLLVVSATSGGGGGGRQDIEEVDYQKTASEEPKSWEASNDMGSEMMKKGGGDQWWGGVTEEIGEIEWPAFGKVVGTTGVVLAVIAGSSVVLLTVNAVLAELSDRVFAGRGIQDFFG